MNIPAPVDLNKLKGILVNSKKVMKVVEEKFPSKKQPSNSINEEFDGYNNYQAQPYYNENDEKEIPYLSSQPNQKPYKQNASSLTEVRDYTLEDIKNSNLPPLVKEAMINKPIPKINALSTGFSLEGLEDLIEPPKQRQVSQQRQISEQTAYNNDNITISLSKLNELIDKRVNERLAELYTKTISEQTIKKTLNHLISEGKLNVKKQIIKKGV